MTVLSSVHGEKPRPKEVQMETCAHEGCQCELSENAHEQDGKRYCSAECARGESCGHGGCDCGD